VQWDEKQTDAAMDRIISSTQRIFGTTLQIFRSCLEQLRWSSAAARR